jgi:hypothetical protein
MPRRISLEGLRRLCQEKGWEAKDLAYHLDIGVAKAQQYLSDKWKVIDRCELERMLDAFRCELEDVFQSEWNPFFCPRIPGAETGMESRWYISAREGHRDAVSIGKLRDFLDLHVLENVCVEREEPDALVADTDSPIKRESRRLEDLLNEASCIVLGTPVTNRLAGEAVRLIFGDAPPPFSFEDVRVDRGGSSSGIVAKGKHFKADYIDPKAFQERYGERIPLKDVGLALVANVQAGNGKARKLILLAGITRMGTEGATEALTKWFRYMDPAPGGVYWGLVTVSCVKPANSRARIFEKYEWAHNAPGRRGKQTV